MKNYQFKENGGSEQQHGNSGWELNIVMIVWNLDEKPLSKWQ